MASITGTSVCLVAITLLSAFHIWINARQPEPYMDELFHVPQACEICNAMLQRRKPTYDPSITTLPGLYVVPAIICMVTRSTMPCNGRLLRLYSMAAALLALPMMSAILRRLRNRADVAINDEHWKLAFLLWLHPVFLFYANLYYTDALAILCTLLTWNLALAGRHGYSALAGIAATFTRQTHMVWHAYIVFDSILYSIDLEARSITDMIYSAVVALGHMAPHLFAGLLYLAFLVVNRGPAVGDREHHSVTLHYAMFPYFLGFHAVSFLLFQILSPRRLFRQLNRLLRSRDYIVVCVSVGVALAALVVATGAKVHPFVLADNRHFVFYIYSRWLLRSSYRRLILVPIYTWALVSPYIEINDDTKHDQEANRQKSSSNSRERQAFRERVGDLILMCCAAATLIPSPLLEPRYFSVASSIFSMRRLSRAIQRVPWVVATLLSALLVIINIALVYVFAELPFERPRDVHMPMDRSPGRFMF